LSNDNLSPQRRRLAAALKQLRATAQINGRMMAADLGWSQSKISRAERGLTLLDPADVARWLTYCAAPDDQQTDLQLLAEQVQVEVVTNRQLNQGGHAQQQRNRIEYYADIDSMRIYQPEVVPGMLQTASYARALLLAIGAATPDTVGESVTARLDRQALLYDESKTIEAVITETALAWQPATAAISREQLDRLATLAKLPNVHIGIVSRQAMRRTLTCNSFTLASWPDGRAEVNTESLTAEVVITDDQDVAAYDEMWRTQKAAAVYGSAAADLLHQLVDELDEP
jgi:hypothetical protein